MPTNTTNYNLIKPNGNEFYDVKVQNDNMDTIDEVLKTQSDNINTKAPINNPIFTGAVTLPGNPIQNLHAATKQYVDDVINDAFRSLSVMAVCETGSNANGTWRKWADGTLECWLPRRNLSPPHNVQTWKTQGIMFYYTNIPWTFPYEFTEITFFTAHANPPGHADFQVSFVSPTNTSTNLRIFTPSSSLQGSIYDIVNLTAYAIGRWKE